MRGCRVSRFARRALASLGVSGGGLGTAAPRCVRGEHPPVGRAPSSSGHRASA
jgi:hypothetical protein